MDNSNYLIIINIILHVLTLLDHYVQRLKKSSCCGFQAEMKEDKFKNQKTNENI